MLDKDTDFTISRATKANMDTIIHILGLLLIEIWTLLDKFSFFVDFFVWKNGKTNLRWVIKVWQFV